MRNDNENPEIPGLTAAQAASIIDQWRDKDREEFEASFDEGWKIASEAIEQLKTDPVAEKIKTFRDKYHAHLEMTPLGQDPGPFDVNTLELSFSDLFGFLDHYIPPLFELVRVLTGSVGYVEGYTSWYCGRPPQLRKWNSPKFIRKGSTNARSRMPLVVASMSSVPLDYRQKSVYAFLQCPNLWGSIRLLVPWWIP